MSSFTKNYTTGDVVAVYFPHQEDQSKGELRWVICLEDLHDKIIAIPLKSNIEHQKFHPKSFVINKDSEEGVKMKLLNDSLIVTDRVSTIDKVPGIKHGHCSDELIDKLLKLL